MKKSPELLQKDYEKRLYNNRIEAEAATRTLRQFEETEVFCPKCGGNNQHFSDESFRCSYIECELFLAIASGSQMTFDF